MDKYKHYLKVPNAVFQNSWYPVLNAKAGYLVADYFVMLHLYRD